MKIKIYNQKGEVVGEEKLDSKIFDCPVKEVVVHQVVTAIEANARQNLAHTKTRGEVRGGGRKPWRQKGTGRARHGSIRSPIWIGGGVTFGPRNERNFKQKINKKMRQKAYFMCLSDKASSGNLIVLDKLELEEMKTKKLVEILKKLPVGKKTLVAISNKDEKIIKSTANIPWVDAEIVGNLNALEVIRHKYLLMTTETIKKIEERYKDK
ncbi:MAG: 50S ribosomal protein L4 [Patescibacteria group bacterium]|nr:50S ribosomal protein L4 [Patescibacteria group bacterium]